MAQVDYFLKLKGVDGESGDAKHKGEIELDFWTYDARNCASFKVGSGGGSGRVILGGMNLRKKTDKASVRLFVACCTGEHFDSAVLVCRKAGKEQQEFLTVTLSSVVVDSYLNSCDSDMIPMESFSLSYTKIESKYREQKADGTLGGEIIGGWNALTNKRV